MNLGKPFAICFCGILMSMALAAPKHKLYVIGDSTLSVYDASQAPRTGWAQVLQQFVNLDSFEVVDKALSGRSSRSFHAEGAWTPIQAALKSGDVVLIEFGHNDEKTDDPDRGTLPGSTFEQYLSIYIDDTRAKGAIPVLGTPIERNGWSSATKVKASHGAYPQAIRDLAAKKGVALVDMTSLTTALYEKLGKDTTTNRIFLNLPAGTYPNYPTGNTDNTHLQLRGATEIAKLFAIDVVRQKMAPLAGSMQGSGIAYFARRASSHAVPGPKAIGFFDLLGRLRPQDPARSGSFFSDPRWSLEPRTNTPPSP